MVSERDADPSTFCPDYLTVYDDWPGLSSREERRVVIQHSFKGRRLKSNYLFN
jgi:hypothetical protein